MIVLRGLLKDKGLMGVTCLWSGLGSSAVLSILVGAVHWLSFSAAKRWASGISSNHELGDEVKANFIGAGAGALCTALVESPIEEFRHRAQAGVISGSLGKEMARSISQFGFLSLYAGTVYLATCLDPLSCLTLEIYSLCMQKGLRPS